MATKDGDWRDLFDVALFEPNRTKLRQCIEHAKHAIEPPSSSSRPRLRRKRKSYFGDASHSPTP